MLLLGALLLSALPQQTEVQDVHALARLVAAEPSVAGRQAIIDGHPTLLTHDFIEALLNETDAAGGRADLPAATILARFTVRVAERIGDTEGLIEATINLGVTFGQRGDYVQATAAFRDGLDRARTADRLVLQTMALNNLGIVHRRLGELDLSLDYFGRSLALAERVNDLQKQANTLNNIGVVLVQQGKYRAAWEYYERSLAIKKRLKTKDLMTTLVNMGELQRQQDDYDLALKYFREALSFAEGQGARLRSWSPLNGIGRVHASRSEFTLALDYYGRALAIAEQATDQDTIAVVHLNIGIVLARQGRLVAALDRFNRSLSIRVAIGDAAGQAETLIQLALLDLSQKKYDDVLTSASRAAEIAGTIGHRVERWKALTLVGQAEQALGHDARARSSLGEAIADIEAMRDEVAGGDEATQRFFEWRLDPYYALIDLHVSAGRGAEALATAERVRGRVVLDALRFGHVDVTKSLTADEHEREREIARSIANASAKLEVVKAGTSVPRSEVDRLSADLAAARLARSAYQATLYAAHPELKTRRGEVPDIHVDEVLSLLPPGRSAAVEFAVTAERTYLFVLRRNGERIDLSVFTIPIAKRALADRVERFRRRLASRDLAIRVDAKALYALLLGPAARLLADRTSLTILPDGPLWSLPFQALESAPGRYLIEQAAVSYAPSLAVLREMRRLTVSRAAGGPRRSLLAIGNSGAGSRAVTLGSLPPLVEAERQARTIAAVYGASRSTVQVGGDARGDHLAQEASRHQVIHIAAHGIFDDVSPMHSYVVLAPSSAPGAGGRSDEGYVEAADLVNMDVQADLVVLASCDTARGRLGSGEGLIGLSWALFVAGSPSAVVSQWKVDAGSTTELMRAFHRRIAARFAPGGGVTGRAVALREAALTLLRNPSSAHPFYWAPFVLIGDGM